MTLPPDIPLPEPGDNSWSDWAADEEATSDAFRDGVSVDEMSATGTRDATTFLRGDNTWATPSGGTGGGVTDHGQLTGLSDDDHPQYLTQARGEALGTSSATADTIVRRDASGNFFTGRVYLTGTQSSDPGSATRRDYADTKVAGGNGVTAIVALTQAAYDALATKVSTTLYVIQG